MLEGETYFKDREQIYEQSLGAMCEKYQAQALVTDNEDEITEVRKRIMQFSVRGQAAEALSDSGMFDNDEGENYASMVRKTMAVDLQKVFTDQRAINYYRKNLPN